MNIDNDKDIISLGLNEMKQLFGRSLVASRNLKKGEIIDQSCFLYKKPGGGLGLDQKSKILNKKLLQDVQFDEPFKPDHFL